MERDIHHTGDFAIEQSFTDAAGMGFILGNMFLLSGKLLLLAIYRPQQNYPILRVAGTHHGRIGRFNIFHIQHTITG